MISEVSSGLERHCRGQGATVGFGFAIEVVSLDWGE